MCACVQCVMGGCTYISVCVFGDRWVGVNGYDMYGVIGTYVHLCLEHVCCLRVYVCTYICTL